MSAVPQAYVVGPPRPLAAIKDTNWVVSRKPIAAQVPQHAVEGLLQTDEGCLLEGLVTNLFVIRAFLPAGWFLSEQSILLACIAQCCMSGRLSPLTLHQPALVIAREITSARSRARHGSGWLQGTSAQATSSCRLHP